MTVKVHRRQHACEPRQRNGGQASTGLLGPLLTRNKTGSWRLNPPAVGEGPLTGRGSECRPLDFDRKSFSTSLGDLDRDECYVPVSIRSLAGSYRTFGKLLCSGFWFEGDARFGVRRTHFVELFYYQSVRACACACPPRRCIAGGWRRASASLLRSVHDLTLPVDKEIRCRCGNEKKGIENE